MSQLVTGFVALSLVLAVALPGVGATAAPSGNGLIGYATENAIRVVNPDGSGARTLAAARVRSGPVWSPDGSRVAFGTGTDEHEAIAVVNADGSGRRIAASQRATNPVWSPDGARIAFNRFAALYVVSPNGTGETLVTAQGSLYEVTWSPDSSQLAFTRGEKLVVSASDGTEVRTIDVPRATMPAWSPDGSRIAFLTDERLPYLNFCCAGSVYVVGADGRGLTRVSRTLPYASGLRWSPDGTKLLVGSADYEVIAAIPYPSGPGTIQLYAPDGSGAVLAGQVGTAPTWSPDGTRLVFARADDRLLGVGHIYVSNADGSCAARVRSEQGFPGRPAWQPIAGKPPRAYLSCVDLALSRLTELGAPATAPTVHDVVRMTLRLTNRGNRPANAVSVRVDLPLRLNHPNVTLGGRRCRVAGRQARCTLERLLRGESTSLIASGSPARAGRYSFVATARATEVDLEGADNRSVYRANAVRCTATGSAKGDVLQGTARRDLICGLGGADRLRGLAGSDQLAGHGGRDVLDGGRGRDTLWGGAGSDLLLVRDRTPDVVICGSGVDRVEIDTDAGDFVAADCERVVRG